MLNRRRTEGTARPLRLPRAFSEKLETSLQRTTTMTPKKMKLRNRPATMEEDRDPGPDHDHDHGQDQDQETEERMKMRPKKKINPQKRHYTNSFYDTFKWQHSDIIN